MLVSQHPVFRRFWYPTLRLAELAGGPSGFTLLGEDIVLWLQADGSPAALLDRCPHRSVKLSVDSTVVDGALACGYHGWQFGGTGTCLFVPQMPELPPGSRAGARSFRTRVAYGLVWVCLADDPLADIPSLPHDGDPAFRQVFEYAQEWDAPFLRVCENSLDVSHISYVHRATIGNEEKPAAPRLTMLPMELGVRFRCDLPVANRAEQQRNLRIAEPETVRQIEITWHLPSTFVLHFTYPNGLVHAICGFAVPIDDRRCRRMQLVYRSDTEADAPGGDIAAFDRLVGSEDRRILETCLPDFPLDPRAEAHMALDRPGLEMRALLRGLVEGVLTR
jgi:hypothetical protein